LSFREVPVVEIVHMPRPGEPALGAGESSSVPGTAAIANAIFDATGVRFRAPPFTPEVVRAALNPLPPAAQGADADAPSQALPAPVPAGLPPNALLPRQRRPWARVGALLAAGVGIGLGVLGWRPAIAPVQSAGGASVYNAATLERGRLLAAAGDCAVCHTAPGGAVNAGGRAMDTPFGRLYTSNLTPDPETGLGRWSFSAFQRAMREGLSRDGHHLYPAFPYTAFAKMSDDDLTALYAWLMSQPPVRAETPAPEMRFPFNQRWLMAGWNALYHDPRPWTPEPGQSPEWNRGAYLVQGLGHCGACHTPRNALGAEQGGAAFLSGALIDGWEAPALTGLSRAPVPWTRQALYDYLRHGHSAQHGVALGPMAPVVRELQALPDSDIRAMATYLASFNPSVPDAPEQAARQVATAATQAPAPGRVQRLFEGACAACHHDGDGPRLLGANVPLALSSKLHSEHPDNLLRTLLHGVREPATTELGFMPAFDQALSDTQLVELAGWLRQRYAPGQPAWADLPGALARLRAAPAHP
jgi:nicotinate dehydrogenase subunit B